MNSRQLTTIALACALVVSVACSAGSRQAGSADGSDPAIIEPSPRGIPAPGSKAPATAFTPGSYWNRPLDPNVALDPDSVAMIEYLVRDSTHDYVRLAGTGRHGRWGMPVYEARRGDPVYEVASSCPHGAPPEFENLRIPTGADPDPTGDGAMTVFDRDRGIVAGLWRAEFDQQAGTWTSCGGAIYYLDSGGLDGSLPASDEQRNRGHRGVPPTTWAVRWDEIRAGAIPHVLKLSVDTTRCEHRFPMVGDECGTWARFAPPEGTRIRIAPEVDLTTLDLDPAALIVATALQRYGAVIGDQSNGAITLKVENRVASTGQDVWEGILRPDSLSAIPIELYEIVSVSGTRRGASPSTE